jgi:hypothetical protein
MAFKVRLKGDYKKLDRALRRAPKATRRHMRRATAFIGRKGAAIIRQEIRNGTYEPNAPLTVAIKGAQEPLKGYRAGAPLFKAVTSKIIDDFTVFIGVLQTNREYNIARTVHEGVTIKVTPRMRGLFFVLWKKEHDPTIVLEGRAAELWEQMSEGWLPLKESTTAIVIPSRPFIKNAWFKGGIQSIAKKIWGEAVRAALKEAKE